MTDQPEAEPKRRHGRRRFWDKLLHAGDISGKLLTLIALPSAIAAVIAYYDEIGDVVTQPDVVARVQSVGIRCALAINIDRNRPNFLDWANRTCGEEPISAWVDLELHNDDSIDRTIVAIKARLAFPDDIDLERHEIELTQARTVEDVLQNDFKVDQRSPWQALQLGPGQQIPIEIDFRPFAREQQVAFNGYRALIKADPSPLPGADIRLDILARFSGSKGWMTIGGCDLIINSESVKNKSKEPFIRALTSSCS
ncbi:MAG: hypothetical protein GY748_16430 [Planctomycetaceae bacterium]|nr:hypothetical protein [Planctomycetaceae bacterium]